jgi:hypothetical protein
MSEGKPVTSASLPRSTPQLNAAQWHVPQYHLRSLRPEPIEYIQRLFLDRDEDGFEFIESYECLPWISG